MTPLNITTSCDQNPTTADTASDFFLLIQGLTEAAIPTSLCQLEQEQILSFYCHLLKESDVGTARAGCSLGIGRHITNSAQGQESCHLKPIPAVPK